MATYATEAQFDSACLGYTSSASTTPTRTQVTEWVTDATSLINGREGLGVTSNATDSDGSLRDRCILIAGRKYYNFRVVRGQISGAPVEVFKASDRGFLRRYRSSAGLSLEDMI